MSEKRFFDGTNILKTEEIVDLLNSLSEENEQLRNSMKKLENVDLVIELKYSYGYGGYLADVRVVDHE